MPQDVYTAAMGQPPQDDDMGSIQSPRRRLTGATGMDKVPAMAPVGRSPVTPNPADANIFTADKGIQPPSPDEGPTMNRKLRKPVRKMSCGGKVKKMAAGGSASKRADGIAQKGKTRGKFC